MVKIPGVQAGNTQLTTTPAEVVPSVNEFDVAGQVVSAAGKFLEAREQARQAEEHNSLTLEATKRLNELEMGFQARNDYENFNSEYAEESKKIFEELNQRASGGNVSHLLKRDFDKISLTKALSVDKLSFQKQKSRGIATLNQSIEDISSLTASASSGQERDFLINRGRLSIAEAFNTGLIDAEEAQKRESKLLEGIDLADAMRSVREDPEGFDAEEFPSLDETTKIRLTDTAIRLEEKQDRELDKIHKEKQEKTKFDFVDRIVNGDIVSLDEIKDAVDKDLISPQQGEQLQKSVLNPPPRQNDPYAFTEVNRMLVDGTLTINDVYAFSGKLTPQTTQSLLEKLTSGIQSNPAVKRAIEIIDAEIEEDGLFGIRNVDNEQKFNKAIEEIIQRSLEGQENPIDIANEIKERVFAERKQERKNTVKRKILRRIGENPTRDKVTQERADLLQRFQNKEIREERVEEEAKALEEILEELR